MFKLLHFLKSQIWSIIRHVELLFSYIQSFFKFYLLVTSALSRWKHPTTIIAILLAVRLVLLIGFLYWWLALADTFPSDGGAQQSTYRSQWFRICLLRLLLRFIFIKVHELAVHRVYWLLHLLHRSVNIWLFFFFFLSLSRKLFMLLVDSFLVATNKSIAGIKVATRSNGNFCHQSRCTLWLSHELQHL